MAFTSSNKVDHGFFPKKTSINAVSMPVAKKSVFLDVGGNGDCGFRAIAAGIIDNFLEQSSHLRGDLLKKVLDAHFNYFPQQKTLMPGLVKPADRMAQLIRTTRMGELVQSLAYTLRQMAVDELCANPENYRGAFVTQHENTSPETMRQPTIWIDESSIAALSNALDLPVNVVLGDHYQTLRKRLRYNEAAANPPVEIRLQGEHYIPRLVHSDRFSLVKTQTDKVLQPHVSAGVDDPSLSDILAKIAAEDKRLVLSFEATCNRLNFMVANGELSQDDLLSIYIGGMDHSDYLSNRAKHASVEHGNQDFFNLIINAQKGNGQFTGSNVPKMTDELIHAISRAISIGHMSDEVIDKKLSMQPHII